MTERRERSAEEREAARLERERRRAGAAGTRAPDPAPTGPDAAPADADLAPADADRAPADADLAPADADLAPADAGPPAGGDEELDWEDAHETASGTRRVSWHERAQAAPAPDRPGHPTGRPAGGPRGRRRVIARAAALAALLLGAALIWFCVELFQPFHGSGRGSILVTIPEHTGASEVGDLLQRDGVISSGFFFDLRIALEGDRGRLLAGSYRLQLGMSYGQVLKILTTPATPAKVTNVTIVPGRTRHQVDALLREQGVRGSYLASTRHSSLLNPAVYGAPRGTPSLEGFLFPDSYQLREPISIPALVADQLITFRRRFASVNFAYARRRHLTPYDVLIIASMVEAEAATQRDRPLIASVIYNRLADGMPLQIDATTRYATGNYTRPLTESELGSPSPYNTRIHKGLPPTPIDSPAMASIQAAAHPAKTDYLYFVVKPCGNGEHAFASSYTQFLADVQRYYSARAARGGRSPAKC